MLYYSLVYVRARVCIKHIGVANIAIVPVKKCIQVIMKKKRFYVNDLGIICQFLL